MLRIGAPVFEKTDDPMELARAHKRHGYRAAYVPGSLALGDSAHLRAFAQAFAQEDVTLAEVGAWCNLIAPDPAKRKRNFDQVCRRLALADAVGARCCVDYLGTLDPHSDFGPHPENLTPAGFELAVQTVRGVIDAVQPGRSKFALEMMQWILPDSVEVYLELLRAVDRPAFAVHLDPVNLIVSPRIFFDTTALLRHCFKKLGPHIVSCHAKDLILRNALALHFDEVPPGQGNLDYRTYLGELAKLGGETPLLLEHLPDEAAYAKAHAHLVAIAGALNLAC